MPDIMIRGVDMPHSCFDCWLNHGEKRPEHGLSIVCKYSYGVVLPEVIGVVGRLPTCGLLELKPHGDLIDRSELNNSFESSDFDGEPHDNVYSAICVANSMPVIVPASEEVESGA